MGRNLVSGFVVRVWVDESRSEGVLLVSEQISE